MPAGSALLRQVPDTNRVVVAPGHQAPPVEVEGQPRYRAGMPPECVQLPATVQIPDPDRAVREAARHPPAVGSEGETLRIPRDGQPLLLDLPLRRHVPDTQGVVGATGEDAL